MPGRQAHGRSLLPAAGPRKERKPSRGSRQGKALDAFATAEKEVPTTKPRGVRTRDLDNEPAERSQKRQHEDDDEEDDDEDEVDDAPRKKKARKGGEDEFQGFSDASDEEWHVGVGSQDEDSEIDSDEAFGDSDEEKFEGYGFTAGKTKKSAKHNRDEEEDEEDLESLGSDAIDLATALDQFSEDESTGEEEGSGSEEEGEEASSEESSDSEDDDAGDLSKLDALQRIISGFGDEEDDEEVEAGPKKKAKISLQDLGLTGVKDQHIKNSLKLMKKEEKVTKTGSSKKLAVPLAKRQQDKLLRSAAYEKTTETLDRWIDTVKQNRRADHLMFPLAQNAHDAGLDNQELMPITHKTSGTELEQTILAIMEESGLGPSAKPEKKEGEEGEAGPDGPTMAEQIELARQRRKEREQHSREAARAKRIKKIKSKAYRRIHRKEALREEQANHEAALEAGALDSEEEREAQDKRRALERMGTRHRESKWAKLGKKAGRAVWDEDFRAGLTEMAQRKDELQRRIEGRTKNSGSDEDDDDGISDVFEDSDDESDKRQLLEQLDRAAAYDDEEAPSGLMAMKFMQRGEAERKKANDDLVDQIRRELDSGVEDSEPEEVDIGRRQYGMGSTAPAVNPFMPSSKAKQEKSSDAPKLASSKSLDVSTPLAAAVSSAREPSPSAPGAAGSWSRAAQDGRKTKKAPKGKVDEMDLSIAGEMATRAPKPAKASKPSPVVVSQTAGVQILEDSDDEDAIHLPMAIRDRELINRAFGGEDVYADFEREKGDIEKEDDDKEIDNTLPGWGGWVGEGISSREKRRHQGRFITKIEGVKRQDRKDFKLKDAIISERRVKKVWLLSLRLSPLLLTAAFTER